LSADPLGFVDGLNLYLAYFVPNGIDPSGLLKEPLIRDCCNSPFDCDDDLSDKENCELAEAGGATEIPGKGKIYGFTICCGGKKIACVSKEQYGNANPGIIKCIKKHEADHFDDVDCPKTGMCQPDWKKGKDPEKEECTAFLIQLNCLLDEMKNECDKKTGKLKKDCESNYKAHRAIMIKGCQENCKGDERAKCK
ncbi:MAG: hypothetical protein JKY95_19405, partial [Planctomycetaceae bacterium]|nr:hypothetical protein [Planctomycetaceae bacterium]